MLGEDCLFDRIENATFRQEATDIFLCWYWMWNPDFLHRRKSVTIFPPGAGQVPDLGGLRRHGDGIAPPPWGIVHNLIIHLDRIEDWSPPLP